MLEQWLAGDAEIFLTNIMDTSHLKAALGRQVRIEGATFNVDWCDLVGEAASFIDCLFEDAEFANTVFASATFVRCRFLRCRFSHADLRETVFEACVFAVRDGEAGGCVFAFSDLRQARFLKSDLSLCQIDRSNLFAIEMAQCNLRGVRFYKAEFSHAYSRKTVTTRAVFRGCNLELADLTDAGLATCELTGSRLREADFSGADLSGADLRDCDLFQAVLAGTRLDGADLRGAEISGLNLMTLRGFAGLKVTQGQQHILLAGIGIAVYPEPG